MRAERSGGSDFPGLYVHIPFCASRCAYCAFASGIYGEDLAWRYIEALKTELRKRDIDPGTEISTLFVGGGTPSVLTTRQLEALLQTLPRPRKCAETNKRGEVTVEGNPDSLDAEKLRLARDLGVTRISIGVQTFSEKGLALLGRRHDARQAERALAAACSVGFASVNADLMMAWPGQTVAGFQRDLERAVALGVTHLSCYTVMFEENTPLAAMAAGGAVTARTDDEERVFWDCAERVLGDSGFIHYEISNYAKPGFACRHNCDCWRGRDYFGVGAAAHSCRHGRRFANHADVFQYIDHIERGASPECFSERLLPEARAKEGATLWLRLAEGIELEAFADRFGVAFTDLYARELSGLLERKCLEFAENARGGGNVRLTAEMFPLADAVLVELI